MEVYANHPPCYKKGVIWAGMEAVICLIALITRTSRALSSVRV